jgi:glutamate carboxypeptidase
LDDVLAELQAYVEMETPTHNKAAVDKLGAFIADRFAALGGKVSKHRQTEAGDQLRIEFGEGEEQIMVLAHFDTVKEIGTLEKEPWRIEDGKAYGPGTYDMKAGIVFTYFAMKAILEHNLPLNKKVVLFLNTDEETGSHSSWTLIQEESRRSELVLVVEPAYGNGDLKTARKGGGDFVLQVHGRAAHAGNEHHIGVNAIVELAQHAVNIQSWTDYDLGTTLSVGTFHGGSVSNVVPEFAEAVIDVRVSQVSEAERITRLMNELKPIHPEAKLVVTGAVEKYPMERTAETERLFHHAQEQARLEGFDIGEKMVGGTSDGNIASTVGTPVLDGLGPVGDGAHASHEHIVIDAIPSRIALILRMLTTL